jgi:FtsP/CotA-like multicopper oxidase with cupredoxin domain
LRRINLAAGSAAREKERGNEMNRREFLKAASAATALAITAPAARTGWAAPSAGSIKLEVAKRTIDVNGKAAEVFGLLQPDGTHGVRMDADAIFDVELANKVGEPTLIHWHGLTPPWEQDGVPDNPAALLGASESRKYAFPVGPGGTHWMHAHTLQEQKLLASPLIVRTAQDRAADEQEVVILLHDFSFKSPEELLAGLKKPSASTSGAMGDMPMMDHGKMGHMMNGQMMDENAMSDMPMMGMMGGMDVNDIEYDAYLANDRTFDDPEVIKVDRNDTVRLRIINGATATGFTVDLGALPGDVIAVDGQAVNPVTGRLFPMAMGQRLDIRLRIPAGGGAFPVLALREGGVQRTGIVLATPGASVARVSADGESKGPLLDLSFEKRLMPIAALKARPAARRYDLTLMGNMATYEWAIRGADDLAVTQGGRVEVTMSNMSMMTHPMHLHGHHFQVTAINGEAFSGAVRDTVLVPPMQQVTIAFDAANPGRWPLHCHHLYHMAAGMMTFVDYGKLG